MKGKAQEVEHLSFILWQYLVHLEDTHTKKIKVPGLTFEYNKFKKTKEHKYPEVIKCV